MPWNANEGTGTDAYITYYEPPKNKGVKLSIRDDNLPSIGSQTSINSEVG